MHKRVSHRTVRLSEKGAAGDLTPRVGVGSDTATETATEIETEAGTGTAAKGETEIGGRILCFRI